MTPFFQVREWYEHEKTWSPDLVEAFWSALPSAVLGLITGCWLAR